MHFLWNSRLSLVAMRVSSMYTVSHPSAISLVNIAFIIVWKVAGELVSPKNITVGLNSPLLVMNAAFHLSPFLMCMLLYPCQRSTLVNSSVPCILAISLEIRGIG